MKYFLLILFALPAFAADVLPVDRTNNWTLAGVPGGIPNRTTIYTNRTSSFTYAQLQNWVNNCPSNEVILLPSGSYDMGVNILTVGSYLTIRGATNANGTPATELYDLYIKMPTSTWVSANWGAVTTLTVTNGYAKDSSTLTVSATPGATFAAGRILMMDQTDDGTLVIDGGNDWAHRPSRAYAELFYITGISGRDISIYPPVAGSYWNTSQTIQVFTTTPSGNPGRWSGLENLIIDQGGAGNTYTVTLGSSYASWILNCSFTGWGTSGGAAAVRPTYSVCCEIRGTTFRDQGAVSSSSYAVYPIMVENFRFEDNIFTNLALAMPMIGSVGGVIAYNYGTGPLPYDPSTWMPEYLFFHGGHNHRNLYEGNYIVSPIWFDSIQGGNSSYNTISRNRVVGYWSASQDQVCIALEHDMDYVTIVGNCFGHLGTHTAYGDIWNIDASCVDIYRTNNWNAGSPGIPSSEAIASNTQGDSYLYTATPSYFGTLDIPAYTPVAASTNILSYTNIPAGYRATFGTNPPAASGGGSGGGTANVGTLNLRSP